MSFRTKIFRVCDGCGFEMMVTGEFDEPARWATVSVNAHGESTKHFCVNCWSIGICAILNADLEKKRSKS